MSVMIKCPNCKSQIGTIKPEFALQKENADLRAQLAAAEAEEERWMKEAVDQRLRADNWKRTAESNLRQLEAANKRLEEAGKQQLDHELSLKIIASGAGKVRRIEELERKLAEQQALFNAVLAPRETSIAKLREHFLSEAREEGRKEAVPDGWQVVPKNLTTEMISTLKECESGNYTMREAWNLLLASAQSPASLNAKEGGE